MKRQTVFIRPRSISGENTIVLSKLGTGIESEGVSQRSGKDWLRHQVTRDQYFILNVFERFGTCETTGYTRQEEYLKINFWLGGRHTTVLDGYGQHEHDRPEVFLTCGPADMTKIDLFGRESRIASVALCVLPSFFPAHLGIATDELPEPLRKATCEPKSFSFYRFRVGADMFAAARGILAAPFSVRRMQAYGEAKAVELMCLLIGRLEADARSAMTTSGPKPRQVPRLNEARELIEQHYAEPITLDRVAREVGLNKLALTTGFRQLFGLSVHDFLQKTRMERAYQLLQAEVTPISWIAEAVGYRYSCNFTTAFHAYFGCTPQDARSRRLD